MLWDRERGGGSERARETDAPTDEREIYGFSRLPAERAERMD